MQTHQPEFSLLDLAITVAILFIGLAFIYFFSWREARRLKRKAENHYPSATRVYPKAVNDFLEMDETENFYHN